MRSTIMALAAALALGPALAHTPPPKPFPADVGPGRVAWFDLTTTDLPKSKDFYAALFGWTYAPVPGTSQAVEIESRGTGIGTIRVAPGRPTTNAGVVYVQVDDAAAACEKAKSLGGTVVPGFPFDLSTGIGAIGLIVDPVGHPIGVYSRKPLAPK